MPCQVHKSNLLVFCVLYASSASLLMECPFSKWFYIILDTYWKQHMEIRTQPACLAQHVHSSAGVSPLAVPVGGRVWGAGASLAHLPLVSEGQGTAPVSSRQTDIPPSTPVLQRVFQVFFRFFLAPSNLAFEKSLFILILLPCCWEYLSKLWHSKGCKLVCSLAFCCILAQGECSDPANNTNLHHWQWINSS